MKKIFAVILVVSLLMVAACAFAATSSPSQSTKTTATTPTTTPATDVTTVPLSDGANDLIKEMDEAVESGKPAASVLPEDIASQLGDDAVASEAVGLVADGTKPVDAEFSFPTKYDADTNLVALITCFDANKAITDQFVIPATVLPNGKVKVHFTKEVLEAMEAADSTSMIVFEKKS